jgi:hypothetical protein
MASQTAVSHQMASLTDYKSISGVKSSRVSVPSDTVTTYTSSSQTGDLTFSLPSQAFSMLDPKQTAFCFNLKTSSSSQFCNGNAQSLIKSIEVSLGSSVLDTANDSDVWTSLINDNSSTERSKTLHSMLSGSSESTYKTGAELSTIQRFSIPLSCIGIGSLAEDYFPVAIQGTKVRITLNNSENALLAPSAGTPDFTITDMSLQLNYLELPPVLYNQIVSEAQNVFKIKGSSVRSYTTHMDLANNVHMLPINAHNRSIKSIYTVFRPTSSVNNREVNSCGGRVFPKLIRGSTLVGTDSYPKMPVSCGTQDNGYSAEVMSELVRTFHAAHSPAFSPCYSKTDYMNEAYDIKGSFAYGIDFEEANASELQCGVSSQGVNLFSNFETRTGESSQPLTVTTFVVSDWLCEIALDGSVLVYA